MKQDRFLTGILIGIGLLVVVARPQGLPLIWIFLREFRTAFDVCE